MRLALGVVLGATLLGCSRATPTSPLASHAGALRWPELTINTDQGFLLGGNLESGAEVSGGVLRRGKPASAIGPWAADAHPFATARNRHATAAYAGHLYVSGGLVGGSGSSAALNDVQVAPMNADGSLGTWGSAGASFATPRWVHSSVAYDGYLYVIGGADVSAVALADLQVARIAADGSLGAFAAAGALPVGRVAHASVAYGGYLYVLGGITGTATFTTDVLYAPIHGDGTVGTFTATNSFSGARDYFPAVAWNGWLYVVGGGTATSVPLADVQAAPIKADGSLGAFVTTTSLPAGRYNGDAVAAAGSLWVLGGCTADCNSNAPIADVRVAPINAGGGLGAFAQAPPLATARHSFKAAAFGGHLYAAGGVGSSGFTAVRADVEIAALGLGRSGALGPWAGVTAFAPGRGQNAMASYNGYLYILGGYYDSGGGGCTPYLSDVQYAKLAADGTPATFATTAAFPTARANHAAVAYDGHLYVLGGGACGVSGALSDVRMAPLNADGTAGVWSTNSLQSPGAIGQAPAVAWNGFMYFLGGTDPVGCSGPRTAVMKAAINSDGTLGTWGADRALPGPLLAQGAVAYGGHLYLAGGLTGCGALASTAVQQAAINSDGTLGPWTATSAFSGPRTDVQLQALDGYLYVIGGNNLTGVLADTQAAPINADGSLGAFLPTASIISGRWRFGSAVSNGGLYLAGGCTDAACTNVGNDVQRAAALSATGVPGAWTSTTADSFCPRWAHEAFGYNGALYVLGGNYTGACGPGTPANYTNDTRYAQVAADGTPGAWTTTNAFTTGRALFCSAVHNGIAYVAGGAPSATSGTALLTDVQMAAINANGTLGNWTSAGTLPSGRQQHACAAFNGHFYVTGGNDSSTSSQNPLATVLEATINPNGTLGTFTPRTALPQTRYVHRAVAYGGSLYVAGGRVGGISVDGGVLVAPINADGSLGSWRPTGSLTPVRSYLSLAAGDGHLYVAGGLTSMAGQVLTAVQGAPILSTGDLGAFTDAPGLPAVRHVGAMVLLGSRLYFIDGNDGSNGVTSVFVSPLLTDPAPVGIYSRLIDLGATASSLDSVTLAGSTLGGTVSLQYKVAPASGVFGSTVDKGLVPLGPSGSIVTLGDASVRYLWLRLALDDTQAAALNPDATNQRDVTSIAIAATTIPAAVKFGFATGPQTHAAGTCPSFTVQSQDAGGALFAVAADTTVNLSATGGTASFYATTCPGTPITSLILPSGQSAANFVVNSYVAGTLQITAAGILNGSPTSVTQALVFTPGAPAALFFAVSPTSTSAGTAISPSPQVQVQDSVGNLVTSASDAISLTLEPNASAGVLSGSTSSTASGGTAQFSSLSINRPGAGFKLRARSGSLTEALSAPFEVVAGAPSKVSFTSGPFNVTTGTCQAVTWGLQDAVGNAATVSADLVVTAAVLPSGGTGGVLYSGGTCAGTGAASQQFTLHAGQGTGTLSFSAPMAGVLGIFLSVGTPATMSATQNEGLSATAPTPVKLAFASSQASAIAGQTFSPPVRVFIQDAGGNTATGATNSITLVLNGGGVLNGTTSVAAVAGVATFSGLSAQTAGAGRTLTASAAGLASATSTVFEVVASALSKLAFTNLPRTVGVLACSAFTVGLQDAFGNAVKASADTAVGISGTMACQGCWKVFVDTACGTVLDGASRLTIGAGQSEISGGFNATLAGTLHLTATSGPLAAAAQDETITGGSDDDPRTVNGFGCSSAGGRAWLWLAPLFAFRNFRQFRKFRKFRTSRKFRSSWRKPHAGLTLAALLCAMAAGAQEPGNERARDAAAANVPEKAASTPDGLIEPGPLPERRGAAGAYGFGVYAGAAVDPIGKVVGPELALAFGLGEHWQLRAGGTVSTHPGGRLSLGARVFTSDEGGFSLSLSGRALVAPFSGGAVVGGGPGLAAQWRLAPWLDLELRFAAEVYKAPRDTLFAPLFGAGMVVHP